MANRKAGRIINTGVPARSRGDDTPTTMAVTRTWPRIGDKKILELGVGAKRSLRMRSLKPGLKDPRRCEGELRRVLVQRFCDEVECAVGVSETISR